MYEGLYHQLYCKNGHRASEPHDSPDSVDNWRCCICGEKAVWSNLVDNTNCEHI